MDRTIVARGFSLATERSAFFFLLFLPIIPWVAYLSFLILLFCFIRKHIPTLSECWYRRGFRGREGSFKFKHVPLNRYAYVLLGAVFLSCIGSIHKSLSLGAFAIFLCYFMSYFIFTTTEIPKNKIIRAIVLSGITLSVIGILLYLTKTNFVFEHPPFRIRIAPRTSTLGNANRFAKYLVLSTPIAFAALLFEIPLKERVLPGIFMPLSFFSLWITQSLAGMIATFVALLIVLWAKNKWIVLAVMIVAGGFYGMNYKKVNKLTSLSSPQVRINTLKYIVPKIFKSHPVTGCGLGAYREAASKYPQEKRCLYYHAHNMYAHYLCETGTLGLSAFLLFLAMFFRFLMKFFANHQNKWLVLGGIASIIGLLIHGVAETCIDYLPIGIFFFSLIGILTGTSRE